MMTRNQKRRGRPATGTNPSIGVRMSPETLERLDDWRRKQPDLPQIEQLVGQIAEQRKAGKEVVVVSSGAVGAGMGVLGYERRPGDLAELQACAAAALES